MTIPLTSIQSQTRHCFQQPGPVSPVFCDFPYPALSIFDKSLTSHKESLCLTHAGGAAGVRLWLALAGAVKGRTEPKDVR